jgi:osmotically-inducible protein OsmY
LKCEGGGQIWGKAVSDEELIARIERELEKIDQPVAVETNGDTLVISGFADSEEMRQAVEDVVAEIAPDRPIESNLEIEVLIPEDLTHFESDGLLATDLPDGLVESAALEPGYGPSLTNWAPGKVAFNLARLEEEPYFPPTDPVLTTDALGRPRVLSGFSATSDQEIGVARSASDRRLGDEAIADAIRRELREDALTTELDIDVQVWQGVAHLRGGVSGLEDAENAEAVADRVPGVHEVVEELEVYDL